MAGERPEGENPDSRTTAGESAELKALVREIVRKELDRLLRALGAITVQESQRRPRMVKKTFSIPRHSWDEFEHVYPGEPSNQVTAAIRMYLQLNKTSWEEEAKETDT